MNSFKAGVFIGSILSITLLVVIVALAKRTVQPDSKTLRERVERVTWRTELRHEGCASKGCWRASGAPRMIEAYGIDKALWPHTCSGCGAVQEIYDARWPKIEQEWRAVK